MSAIQLRAARMLLSLAVTVGAVSAVQLDEYSVKAGFVHNFLSFVDWPASRLPAAGPITVCVIGESPISARLTVMAGRPVRGHAVRTRTVLSVWDLTACHVVYVPVTYDGRISEITRRQSGLGQLTISEIPGSLSDAVISLGARDGRMTFEVNLDLAAEQGLTVSSRLLQLAHRVTGAASVRPADAHGTGPSDRPTGRSN